MNIYAENFIEIGNRCYDLRTVRSHANRIFPRLRVCNCNTSICISIHLFSRINACHLFLHQPIPMKFSA